MKVIPVRCFDGMDSPRKGKSKEIRITEESTPTLSAFRIQIMDKFFLHEQKRLILKGDYIRCYPAERVQRSDRSVAQAW